MKAAQPVLLVAPELTVFAYSPFANVRFAITALGVESSVAPIPNTFVTGASVLIGTKGGGIEGKALPPPVPESESDPEPVPPGQTPHSRHRSRLA